jgi:hypothetical protein
MTGRYGFCEEETAYFQMKIYLNYTITVFKPLVWEDENDIF